MRLALILMTLLPVANCDISGDIVTASSAASALASKVNSWDSQSGLFAALGIRKYFRTYSSALVQIARNAASVTLADIDVTQNTSFLAAVSELLAALTRKAKDFQAVGLNWVVGRNLQQLGEPAADIVRDLYVVISDDREILGSLTPAIHEMTDHLLSANSAYGVDPVKFINMS